MDSLNKGKTLHLHKFIIRTRCGDTFDDEEFKKKLGSLSNETLIWFCKWCYSGIVQSINDVKLLKELYYLFKDEIQNKEIVLHYIIQQLNKSIELLNNEEFAQEYMNAVSNDSNEIILIFTKQQRDIKNNTELVQKLLKHPTFIKSKTELSNNLSNILKKENLEESILEDFKEDAVRIREEKPLADIIFSFNEENVSAHKAILHDRCSFLRPLLGDNIEKISDISDRFGINIHEFKILLDYYYCLDFSNIKLDQSNYISIMNLYLFIKNHQEDDIMKELFNHIELILHNKDISNVLLSHIFNHGVNEFEKYHEIINWYVENKVLNFDINTLDDSSKFYIEDILHIYLNN